MSYSLSPVYFRGSWLPVTGPEWSPSTPLHTDSFLEIAKTAETQETFSERLGWLQTASPLNALNGLKRGSSMYHQLSKRGNLSFLLKDPLYLRCLAEEPNSSSCEKLRECVDFFCCQEDSLGYSPLDYAAEEDRLEDFLQFCQNLPGIFGLHEENTPEKNLAIQYLVRNLVNRPQFLMKLVSSGNIASFQTANRLLKNIVFKVSEASIDAEEKEGTSSSHVRGEFASRFFLQNRTIPTAVYAIPEDPKMSSEDELLLFADPATLSKEALTRKRELEKLKKKLSDHLELFKLLLNQSCYNLQELCQIAEASTKQEGAEPFFEEALSQIRTQLNLTPTLTLFQKSQLLNFCVACSSLDFSRLDQLCSWVSTVTQENPYTHVCPDGSSILSCVSSRNIRRKEDSIQRTQDVESVLEAIHESDPSNWALKLLLQPPLKGKIHPIVSAMISCRADALEKLLALPEAEEAVTALENMYHCSLLELSVLGRFPDERSDTPSPSRARLKETFDALITFEQTKRPALFKEHFTKALQVACQHDTGGNVMSLIAPLTGIQHPYGDQKAQSEEREIIQSPAFWDAFFQTRNALGQTPLHTFLNPRWCEALLSRISSDELRSHAVNSQDSKGNTPLHYAFEKDLLHFIGLWMRFGADSFITNASGQNAVQRAQSLEAFLHPSLKRLELAAQAEEIHSRLSSENLKGKKRKIEENQLRNLEINVALDTLQKYDPEGSILSRLKKECTDPVLGDPNETGGRIRTFFLKFLQSLPD